MPADAEALVITLAVVCGFVLAWIGAETVYERMTERFHAWLRPEREQVVREYIEMMKVEIDLARLSGEAERRMHRAAREHWARERKVGERSS